MPVASVKWGDEVDALEVAEILAVKESVRFARVRVSGLDEGRRLVKEGVSVHTFLAPSGVSITFNVLGHTIS